MVDYLISLKYLFRGLSMFIFPTLDSSCFLTLYLVAIFTFHQCVANGDESYSVIISCEYWVKIKPITALLPKVLLRFDG